MIPTDSGLQLYTIAEVARLTGMSEYWLREQCREVKIAHHRLGRSYRLSETNLLELMATTRVEVRRETLTPTRHHRT